MNTQYHDPLENRGGGMSSHLVFEPQLRVAFPDKGESAALTFVILPAFPLVDQNDGRADQSVIPWGRRHMPYRLYDQQNKFSNWLRPYWVHEWVGGKTNIISPATYFTGQAKTDFVKVFIDYVWGRGPNYMHLFGLKPDGKRPDKGKELELYNSLFKGKLLSRYSSRRFLVNHAPLRPDGNLEPASLLSIPESAVINRGKKGQDSAKAKVGAWGLNDELQIPQRGRSGADIAANPALAWYWGDITDPTGAVPVTLCKEDPPTGGEVKMWVAKPTTLDSKRISDELLEQRIELTKDAGLFFPDYDQATIIGELIRLFGFDHPDLLVGAFGRMMPIQKMIENICSSAEEEAPPEEDDIPMHHPATTAAAPASVGTAPAAAAPAASAPATTAPAATAPASNRYAPPASVVQDSVKVWVSVHKAGATSMTRGEAAVISAEHLDGDVMVMPNDQSAPWQKASVAGLPFKAPAPPPPPPAEVAPPPPPPVEAAPPPPPAAEVAPPPPVAAPPPPPAVDTTVSMDLLRSQLGDTAPPATNVPPPPPAA